MRPRAGFFEQFTPDQLRAQAQRCADGLRVLLARAERTGKPANGYSAEALREKIAAFERMSTATDAEVIEGTRQSAERMRARLSELRAGAAPKAVGR